MRESIGKLTAKHDVVPAKALDVIPANAGTHNPWRWFI